MTAPPLPDQITTALTNLRAARDQADRDREMFWDGRLDWLLDVWREVNR